MTYISLAHEQTATPRISTAHVQTAVILGSVANKQIRSQQADQWPYHRSVGRMNRRPYERISTAHVQTAVILVSVANKQIRSQQADLWPYHRSVRCMYRRPYHGSVATNGHVLAVAVTAVLVWLAP